MLVPCWHLTADRAWIIVIQTFMSYWQTVTNAGNLLATPEALGSLWVCFMCSMSASPPRNNLWQMGHDVAFGPPIRAACCCNTGTRSCNSCERRHEDGRTLSGRLDTETQHQNTWRWMGEIWNMRHGTQTSILHRIHFVMILYTWDLERLSKRAKCF
jgi:hypothetical protein